MRISDWSSDVCSSDLNKGEASIDRDLLGRIDLLVTTTGNFNVCNADMLKAIKPAAVVCNIGHFDSEIDTAFMRKNWQWEEIKPQVHKVWRDKSKIGNASGRERVGQ